MCDSTLKTTLETVGKASHLANSAARATQTHHAPIASYISRVYVHKYCVRSPRSTKPHQAFVAGSITGADVTALSSSARKAAVALSVDDTITNEDCSLCSKLPAGVDASRAVMEAIQCSEMESYEGGVADLIGS